MNLILCSPQILENCAFSERKLGWQPAVDEWIQRRFEQYFANPASPTGSTDQPRLHDRRLSDDDEQAAVRFERFDKSLVQSFNRPGHDDDIESALR